MKEEFDMYNQIFEYETLELIEIDFRFSNIKEYISNIKKFTIDYVDIKNTSIEYIKEIHGYSLQKVGGKLMLSEINIPLAQYNGRNKWTILKREDSNVIAEMRVLWERDEDD